MKILAGITKNNEIYIIETEYTDHFSMTGFTIYPVTYKEAKKESFDSILSCLEGEDPEYIKELNERLGINFRTIKNLAKYILQLDGELAYFDNSLYPDEIEYKGKRFLFRSESCGQHQEKELQEYFIPKNIFDILMGIWDKYHLKTEKPKLPEIPEQNWDKLLKKAIKIIRFNNNKKTND